MRWVTIEKWCTDFRDTEVEVLERVAAGTWPEPLYVTRRDGALWVFVPEASKWLAKQRRRAHVYVISEASVDRPIKIGVAANVDLRLSGLQGGNHRQLVVRATLLFRSWNVAYKAEQRAHVNFATARMRGEWFDLAATDAEEWLSATFGRYIEL